MLVVLFFVQDQGHLGHLVRHPSQPLQPAPDLPEPVEHLYRLYIVCAVDVYVSGVDLRHIASNFPEQV
jgi:hypothetical protein